MKQVLGHDKPQVSVLHKILQTTSLRSRFSTMNCILNKFHVFYSTVINQTCSTMTIENGICLYVVIFINMNNITSNASNRCLLHIWPKISALLYQNCHEIKRKKHILCHGTPRKTTTFHFFHKDLKKEVCTQKGMKTHDQIKNS